MSALYPLRFEPIFKDKIWGGQKLRTILNKDFGDLPNCGESWEISGVSGDVSIVANGALTGQSLNELVKQYQEELVGTQVYAQFQDEFPLLIKFIDANQDLSVQVHPDDTLAFQRHQSKGKTEMWYILQADPGSTLISGFNQPLTKESYQEAVDAGKLMETLNQEEVHAGDVYFLPAGRVHTIGKGLLLAEIQQTSDVTYRIFDFDRKDAHGNTRELHTEQALEALDFTVKDDYQTHYQAPSNSTEPVVACPYFDTQIQQVTGKSDLALSRASFTILIGVEGEGTVIDQKQRYALKKGETLLIPACMSSLAVESSSGFTFLTTRIPG